MTLRVFGHATSSKSPRDARCNVCGPCGRVFNASDKRTVQRVERHCFKTNRCTGVREPPDDNINTWFWPRVTGGPPCTYFGSGVRKDRSRCADALGVFCRCPDCGERWPRAGRAYAVGEAAVHGFESAGFPRPRLNAHVRGMCARDHVYRGYHESRRRFRTETSRAPGPRSRWYYIGVLVHSCKNVTGREEK